MGLDRPTRRLIDKAHRVARLQKDEMSPVGAGPSALLMLDEGVSAEESLSAREEQESLSRRLERLGGTERSIVLLKYGFSGEPPMALEQIGDRLGVTLTEVQKQFASAMRKLGQHVGTDVVFLGHARESRVG